MMLRHHYDTNANPQSTGQGMMLAECYSQPPVAH
jgi:hypothetical protein